MDVEVFTAGNQAQEALLQQLKGLTDKCPGHQPLACRKALLELRLGKPADALRTAQHFVKVDGGECAPAQWALHLSAHAYWLQGQLPSVRLHYAPGGVGGGGGGCGRRGFEGRHATSLPLPQPVFLCSFL